MLPVGAAVEPPIDEPAPLAPTGPAVPRAADGEETDRKRKPDKAFTCFSVETAVYLSVDAIRSVSGLANRYQLTTRGRNNAARKSPHRRRQKVYLERN